ncbi:MAG: ECF transporter S component [Clostridia bacterium]|nr:ECF transporter S component [Clostridia bacterium]
MTTKAWKLKDILLIAVCAVLFGVVYLGCTNAGTVLYGLLSPAGMGSLGYEPFYGIYFMAGAFAIFVMRKPGTGLVAEVLAAIIECLLGNMFGPKIILSGIVQGLGFELIIAITRYKKFDFLTMSLGAVLCSVLTLIYNLFVSGYSKIAFPVLALMLVVRLVSAVIFDGIITPILGNALAKAGVLKGYAVAGNTKALD